MVGGKGVKVAHGAALGRGVYLGKDMQTALGYCSGQVRQQLHC